MTQPPADDSEWVVDNTDLLPAERELVDAILAHQHAVDARARTNPTKKAGAGDADTPRPAQEEDTDAPGTHRREG